MQRTSPSGHPGSAPRRDPGLRPSGAGLPRLGLESWSVGFIREPAAVMGRPERRPVQVIGGGGAGMIILRALQIGLAAFGLLIAALWARVRPQTAAGLPQRVRRTLEQLGPTFVKLGQALSQRRDLLSSAWTIELGRLQASARPFSAEVAAMAVEAALGKAPKDLFTDFDPAPLAAASVAQVHRARLPDGRAVVVKVLRPGVRTHIDRDMRIVVALAWLGTVLIPFLRRRRLVPLAHEIWRNLRRETDLEEEARNIRRFARAFQDSSTVFIPDVIDTLSARDVLVQEMSHGRDIGDAALAGEAKALAQAFVNFYLEQFFRVGVFHADPHPGNIFVLEDGRLCFHDFGAVGMLDSVSRRALMAFVQAFAAQDPVWLADAASDLGLLTLGVDHTAVVRGVEAILVELEGVPLESWSIAGLMVDIARLGGGDAVALPPHLAVLMRTVFTAEGTLRTLDPRLNVTEMLSESAPKVLQSLDHAKGGAAPTLGRFRWEMATAARDLPQAAARWLHDGRQGGGLAIRLPDATAAADRLGRSADRIALALVALGLYIAASLLMQHSIGPRILGDLPLLAALGYGLALWFTFRLVRHLGRTDRS